MINPRENQVFFCFNQLSSFVERLDTDDLGNIARYLQNQPTQSLTA